MTQINLHIEDKVKKEAEEACAEIGLSLSTAINIYPKIPLNYTQVIR